MYLPTSDIIVNKIKNYSLIDYMHGQQLRVKNSRSDCTTVFNEKIKSTERVPLHRGLTPLRVSKKNWSACRQKITSKARNLVLSTEFCEDDVTKKSQCTSI